MDEELLATFNRRCVHVENLIHRTLNNEKVYGFYLFGPHGCGKSTAIEYALRKFDADYLVLTGTATGPGLFMTLASATDKVIWVNDDPKLMKDPQAIQYLLHMLEPRYNPATKKTERFVKRTRERVKEGDPKEFVFTGKLIFDSNVDIKGHPTLLAVRDRLNRPLHFNPSNDEMAAVIRYWVRLKIGQPSDYSHIRLTSEDEELWKSISAKRVEVADYVLALEDAKNIRHSMRAVRDIISYRVDAEKYNYETNWKDHAEATIGESDYEHSVSQKDERLENERQSLREILEDIEDINAESPDKSTKADVISIWMEVTEKESRQFYRRLEDLSPEYRAMYEKLPDKRSS